MEEKISFDNQDFFFRLYVVFKNNINLLTSSINTVGKFASDYDTSMQNEERNLLRRLKTKTVTKGDLDNLIALSKQYPEQSNLFKRSTVVALVATIDEVFSEVLYHYYKNHVDKLELNDKKISYRELSKYSSIEEIKSSLIDNAIDLILRKSIKERLAILKKIGVFFPQDSQSIQELTKLLKIRNLIVHNASCVDKDYLKSYGDGVIKRGDELQISNEYLLSAITCSFYVCGLVLHCAQIAFHSKHLKEDNYFIQNITHILVGKNRFEYVKEIYDSMEQLKITEIKKKSVVISYCVSLRKQNKKIKSIRKIIDKYTWSSSDEILTSGVLDNKVLFYKKLEEVVNERKISIRQLMTWQVFMLFKNEEAFLKIVDDYIKSDDYIY